jgi:hypothetical protein
MPSTENPPMKKLIIKYKSQWSRPLLAIILVTLAGIFLVFPQQEKASVTPLFPTYTTGSFTFSTPFNTGSIRPNLGVFFQQGGEPEIKVDLWGNIYLTAIQGVPGGTDLFKSINKGASFVYLGQPDGAQNQCNGTVPQCLALGGGDDQIDVSTGGYLYVSSLWLGSVTASTSYDGGTGGVLPGQKWEVVPNAAAPGIDDRQWVAAYGPQTLYMTYASASLTNPPGVIGLFVVKSTDAGKTFSAPTEITGITALNSVDVEGNLVVDPYNGNLYTAYIPNPGSNIINLARSTDGGATWSVVTAYTGPAGTDNRGVFPILAVDRGGNLHLAFTSISSTRTAHVLLTSTANPAAATPTWTTAVQIDQGAATATAVEPWIVAGSPGIVNVTWLGSPAASPDVPSNWHVFFAQVTNAVTASPTIAQNQVETAIMHNHSICFNGGGCTGAADDDLGNRDLLEYYTMTIDPDGNANIAYADSINNCPSATCITNAWFTKQTAGPSAYAPPAAPAPATFGANLALPGSSNAAEPSVWVDSHNCIYGSAPGNPYFWASENAGVSFRNTTVPPALGGGDEDVTTIKQATGARNDALYYADLALADVGIFKSTDRGVTWSSSATPYGQLNASSDRQWISGDRINSNVDQILWELDHELASEDIRIAASINDSVWGTTSGIAPCPVPMAGCDAELGTTIPNTNPGPVFVNKVTHEAVGVFLASTITTNSADPPFGKEPHIWDVIATAPVAGGAPPLNVKNYPIFKGVIDSPSTAPAGTTTFGSHLAAIFPAADADSSGNIYAVWTTLSARPNASIPPGSNNAVTWDLWFASSHDGGKTFYGPFKISSGIGTSVLPWVAAGDAGRVDIVWYQSNNPTPPLVSDPSSPGQLTGGPNMMPVGSSWTVKFAQSLNAASREPVFAVTTASDHIIHTGSISIGGLTGSADRSLLDYFEVAIGPDGLANILSADNDSTGAGTTHINYMRQNGGPLALTNPSSVTCLPIPPVASVVSRKLHGGTLQADIQLFPLLNSERGVECRSPGQTGTAGFDYKIVFTFVNNIPVGGCGTTSTPPGTVAAGPNANQCTVNLNGLTNAQYTTVTLNSVTDVAGNSGPVSAVLGLLVGDVNGDAPNAPGIVDSGDVFLVRQNTGQATTLTNFRKDINASGIIDSGDVFLTRQKTGTQLPTPP